MCCGALPRVPVSPEAVAVVDFRWFIVVSWFGGCVNHRLSFPAGQPDAYAHADDINEHVLRKVERFGQELRAVHRVLVDAEVKNDQRDNRDLRSPVESVFCFAPKGIWFFVHCLGLLSFHVLPLFNDVRLRRNLRPYHLRLDKIHCLLRNRHSCCCHNHHVLQ